ncbi:MAG: hypothetical protein MI749_16425 [Desulfovibrionales bacterium]|nr:hypothetical protein [Desulfovibrionales bacterium]
MSAAYFQYEEHKFAPAMWLIAAMMSIILLYWHAQFVNGVSENTFQTLSWTMSGMLCLCMGITAQTEIAHARGLSREEQPLVGRYVYVTILVLALSVLGLAEEDMGISVLMLLIFPTKLFFWIRLFSVALCLFGFSGFLSMSTRLRSSAYARSVFCQSCHAVALGSLVLLGSVLCSAF